MNYKELGYFERYNKILGLHCDWQVELFTSAHDNEDSLRVERTLQSAQLICPTKLVNIMSFQGDPA